MEKRFIVKSVVSDYGVFDTLMPEAEQLDCICSGKRNADLIADILNTDYSKPNECTYYENKLQQENKQLKEQLAEKDKEINKEIRKQVCDEIRDFIQKNESPSFSQSLCGYWFISAKKLFEYLDQIEQAKEN